MVLKLMKRKWAGKRTCKNEFDPRSYTQWWRWWVLISAMFVKFSIYRHSWHAQYEIRVYAETMLNTVKLPITYSAFLDYRVGAVSVNLKRAKK